MFDLSEAWKAAYPGAHAGILVMHGVQNPAFHAELDARKHFIEDDLRARFTGLDRHALEELPSIQAYTSYYRKFNKTYHVLAQLESIVFKGKAIPSVAALVEAMFMAEVKNALLTAGHDLDMLRLPIHLMVADGTEKYTLLRGSEQILKPGDMFMKDGEGVISSILYGPDQRTQIRADTRNVLFAVYAPQGIDTRLIKTHLEDIRDHILLIEPMAKVQALQIYGDDIR
jgi:DNA/RNA-binding domain of Phe-tRNA-synthetase-like protein